MANSPAHRATHTLLLACVCLSSLALVLGGGEQEPSTSMVLTETHEQQHVSGKDRMSRILKQLSSSKSLKTEPSDVPSLPTVSGLAARFGQKQKKNKKKSAPQQPEMLTGEKLSEDGDSELEKLSESGNDEDNNEDASQNSWGQKAKQVSLLPNQHEEKVKNWLLHPNRAGKYPSWMGIKAPKETNKATVSAKAKAVAKRVQQTALAQTAKQPAAPLPSVLKIHAGSLIVNHVPAKLPAKDAVVPKKESPLQQLRAAHKAVQLATTTKLASSASQAKAKSDTSGNAELNKIEEMSDTSDDDAEEDDMDKEEAKYQSDDDKDWFDKIEEDPDAAIRDSQDGENIKDFLHREAQALKREGKHVGTTKSVLDQQMAEQHETPVVKHITPFVEVQSSPAAPSTPAAQPQVVAKVAKSEQHKVAKPGDTVVPGLHDPLAAMMAKKRTQEVAKQVSQSKSAVDDIIHQLGGPDEDLF